ncbi:uncharacterized protein LOC132294277 [Cornus florida]|uniref:uncharacterized protein LOC132294277 n=1 Tax=Cornus florida TaxID=4283 RepID=UPI002896941B|nr:uncharacterized protein LOC132294277 [Cornus florida]
MMETSPITIAPVLLRNLLTSIFFYADKPLLSLAEKYKLLQFLRHLLISTFLFFLRLLPSLFPGLHPYPSSDHHHHHQNYPFTPSETDHNYVPTTTGGGGAGGSCGGSGIARALSQLLLIVNDIPVSSRKYEVVRSLAETLIDENLQEGFEALLEVNRTVLSAAFSRTLGQLEATAIDQERHRHRGNSGGGESGDHGTDYRLNRVLRAVRYCGDVVWTGFGKSRMEGLNRSGSSAEKLAAEVLWLAQKLSACGSVEEAVGRWASASNLAWLALSAEPRLQGSLVKVSAFLFKQVKDMGGEEVEEEAKEQQRQTKMKMLMSWLPLLCRASNGVEAPVLSIAERNELEKILEETIETLKQEEEQEKVLSLWLHHFTYCPSSDWPNLHACYARWCTASRKLLLRQ